MKNLRCYKSQQRFIRLEKDLHHTLADLHSLPVSQEASGTPSRDGNTGSRLLGILFYHADPILISSFQPVSAEGLLHLLAGWHQLHEAGPHGSHASGQPCLSAHLHWSALPQQKGTCSPHREHSWKIKPYWPKGRVLLHPIGCLIHKLIYPGSGRVLQKSKS